MKRRDFIKSMALCGGGLLLPKELYSLSLPVDKTLNLHNIHTGESIKATFFAKDHFVFSEIKRLNHFLRDYRLNKTANMDIQLFPLLYAISLVSGSNKTIDIISGYRSKQTNEYLRVHEHRKVAKGSYHTRAMAIDFKIKDRYLKDVLRVSKLLKTGGVGYYPNNQFIHVDTGPIRYWKG